MERERVKAFRIKYMNGEEEVIAIHSEKHGHGLFILESRNRDCGAILFYDADNNQTMIPLSSIQRIRLVDATIVRSNKGDGHLAFIGKDGKLRMHNPLEDPDHYEDELN